MTDKPESGKPLDPWVQQAMDRDTPKTSLINYEETLFDILEALKAHFPDISGGFARGTGGVDRDFIVEILRGASSEPAIAEGDENLIERCASVADNASDDLTKYGIADEIRALAQSSTPPVSKRVEVPAGWKLVPVECTDHMCGEFTDTALKGSVYTYGGWHGYARAQWATLLAASPTPSNDTLQGHGEVPDALPSHPRANVRAAYTDTMVGLLDAYEQAIWKWAQGCEIDGIQQRSVIGDSYNEEGRSDAKKARSDLIRQIDALTTPIVSLVT